MAKGTYVFFALLVSAGAWAQGQNASPQALAAANAHLETNARALGLTKPGEELRMRSNRTDSRGNSHIRYGQLYKGVPVFEGEAIVHVAPDGAITLTNTLRSGISVDVAPSIAQDAALRDAARALSIRGTYEAPYAALEILPRGVRSPVDALVWHFRIFVENDVDVTGQWDAFIDAQTGNLLWHFDSLETASKGGGGSQAAATAIGNTMYSGARSLSVTRSAPGVYSLQDPTRAGSQVVSMQNKTSGKTVSLTSTTGVFGDFQKLSADPNTAGADAQFGMQATWDYLKGAFGRNGLDGFGKPVALRVHYGVGYGDAFWSAGCYCATFGDSDGVNKYPMVYPGIIGHEMAHGLMQAEANLTYSGESGGLNESNSDIIGALVRFSVYGYPVDYTDWWLFPALRVENYDSSGNYAPIRAGRYMDNPPLNGKQPACWSEGIGTLDVHDSSGPNNHMFYLLAHGGTSVCNGQAVTGIGNADAARIWYEAVTNWMTASTDYHGARMASLNAAAVLFGAGSPQYSAVAAAYSAIDVN